MTRVLVYGFGPYRQFRDNVTQHVLRQLAPNPRLKKIVFPVRFERQQFIAALERYRPEVVLGLGQCSRGRLLRVEARALNARRLRKEGEPQPIARNGAPQLPTSLPIALGSNARRSGFAGDYVCNFSMYVMLDFVKKNRLPTRYGFVHIPHDYEARKAARILNSAIGKLSRG